MAWRWKVRRKTPPWYIEVAKKNKVLARLVVPAHKLPTNALAAFMKALVVRYLTSSPEEMLPFMSAAPRGSPH
jgi:hypothetical protein